MSWQQITKITFFWRLQWYQFILNILIYNLCTYTIITGERVASEVNFLYWVGSWAKLQLPVIKVKFYIIEFETKFWACPLLSVS